MRVLIVCSGNHAHGVSSFIKEQGDSLVNLGVEVEYFLIKGKGVLGYLNNYMPLRKRLGSKKYDLLHAHHGLSGMLIVLQRNIPTIVTFHGGDIDQRTHWIFSFLTNRMADKSIYVHPRQPEKLFDKYERSIIPCGIDLNVFQQKDRKSARGILGLDLEKQYILFASSFTGRPEKNYPIALKAVNGLGDNIEMLELRGYNREEVSTLFSAVDLLLVTSSRETGPLVVKEALACNCPVVSTDVGDVASVISGVEGCFITELKVEAISAAINRALNHEAEVEGRHKVIKFDLVPTAKRVLATYKSVLNTASFK